MSPILKESSLLFCAWKLKTALATILQSSGFLPAFRKIASFPREFSSSYLESADAIRYTEKSLTC